MKEAAKRSRDVIGGEADVFRWVVDPEIVDPDEKAHEGGPVVYGGILIFLVCGTRAGKLRVGGAIVRWTRLIIAVKNSGGINT